MTEQVHTARLIHTADLDDETRRGARALLGTAFGPRFTDNEWANALGGMHALIYRHGTLIAHGSVVRRQLHHRGHTLRAGYVGAVAVAAEHRGQGLATAVLDACEQVIRGAFELGVLSSDALSRRLYTARGWLPWHGPTATLSPAGPRSTPAADGTVFVFPVSAELDRDAALACDFRDGEVW